MNFHLPLIFFFIFWRCQLNQVFGHDSFLTARQTTNLKYLANINTPSGSQPIKRPGYTVIPPPHKRTSVNSNKKSTENDLKSLFLGLEAENTDGEKIRDSERTLTDLHERDSRVGFIRKVYAVLSCQLLCTAGVAIYLNTSKHLLNLMYGPKGQWVMGLALISSFMPVVLLSLSEKLRHSFPTNVGLLAWFTLGESIIIGLFTTFFNTKSVITAMVQTGVAVLGLTLYSFQPNPKYDLTAHGQALFSTLFIFLIFGLMNFFFKSPAAELVKSAVGAALFSLFLIYDTQMIVGGKNKKVQYDSKEYILAALNLYMDIANLFIYLLRLFGDTD
mmetsp:Transcript_11808/g.15425  ORF Transcript_11808/g.15425 Transcript_11808/m.15425 type:complete len:331 (+) Transcript_11808:62-1054(+)